jgi:hypothetical protein
MLRSGGDCNAQGTNKIYRLGMMVKRLRCDGESMLLLAHTKLP